MVGNGCLCWFMGVVGVRFAKVVVCLTEMVGCLVKKWLFWKMEDCSMKITDSFTKVVNFNGFLKIIFLIIDFTHPGGKMKLLCIHDC